MDSISAVDRSLVDVLATVAPIYNQNDMHRYRQDWSGTCGGQPVVVARPASTSEVAQLVAACHQVGQPITVQGGLTGLAGGAAPADGDVVISLERSEERRVGNECSA